MIEIAITYELNKLGVAPVRAAEAAAKVTAASWTRKLSESDRHSRCFLIAGGDSTRVVHIAPDESIGDHLRGEVAATIVDIDRITARVDTYFKELH